MVVVVVVMVVVVVVVVVVVGALQEGYRRGVRWWLVSDSGGGALGTRCYNVIVRSYCKFRGLSPNWQVRRRRPQGHPPCAGRRSTRGGGKRRGGCGGGGKRMCHISSNDCQILK